MLEITQILQTLYDHPDMIPAGSRSIMPWDRLDPETDFDFVTSYTGYTDERVQLLESLGFYAQGEYEYYDDNTAAIYEHCEHPIQVVFKIDINLHRKVFGTMTPEFYERYIWKSAPFTELNREKIRENINMLLEYNK